MILNSFVLKLVIFSTYVVEPKKESRCEKGFTVDKKELRGKCRDIDGCVEYRGFCKGNLHCTNTVGSYICGCRSGFEAFDAMYGECMDINECENRNQCPAKALCINTQGSFSCRCNDGYEGDLCVDIDECSLKRHNCDSNADCKDTGLVVNLMLIFIFEHMNNLS